MDSSHKLDAPNDDELRSIEQLEDRSGLTTIYRAPVKQYDGEVMTAEERERAKSEHLSGYSSGIWKSFLKIGLYIPYPLISGIMLGVGLYTFVGMVNALAFLGLVILSAGLWALTSYFAYAAIFKVFYKHALRAGPFLLVMLVSVLLASQAAYGIVANVFTGAELPLLFNVTIVSIIVLLYSIAATGILLAVWGNIKVKAALKALVSFILIIASGFFAVAVYLF